jgi:hypothetical protein
MPVRVGFIVITFSNSVALAIAIAICDPVNAASQETFPAPEDPPRSVSPSATSNDTYAGVYLHAGQSPFFAQVPVFQINFAYNSSMSKAPLKYTGTIKPTTAAAVAYSFGFEFGNRNGSYAGIGYGITDFHAMFQPTPMQRSEFVQLRYGYSFRIVEEFRIRPSLEIDIMSSNLWAEEKIRNEQVDLTIFGTSFPSKVVKNCGCHTKTYYAKATSVGFQENAGFAKFQLDLTYSFQPNVILSAGVGYYSMLYRNDYIRVASEAAKHNFPLKPENISYEGQNEGASIVSYSNMTFNVGLTITWKTPVPSTTRQGGTGNHYHHYSSGHRSRCS